MHSVCVRCLQVSPEGTRRCLNYVANCPTGTLSPILDPGDHFAEMRIVSLIHVYPTCAVYRAVHKRKSFILKIAHQAYQESLKTEAEIMRNMPSNPGLPKLIMLDDQPKSYGKYSFDDQIFYYLIYNNAPGIPLDQFLQIRGQLTPRQAGHLVARLAETVAQLGATTKRLILNLRVESLLVREGHNGSLYPTLLDYGALELRGERPPGWLTNSYLPSFAAPEVLQGEACDFSADVYGSGGILYHLLIGRPPIESVRRSQEVLRDTILNWDPTNVREHRRELSINMGEISKRSLAKRPDSRFSNTHLLAKALIAEVGEIETDGPRLRLGHEWLQIVLGIGILLIVITILMMIFQP